ncbi:MAG: cell division protein FtsQ/DivIB [Gammaproteobacteria bacterium]|nr:cell division protein FtsQ/DivIB [Gammaproteobacteria bacterium]TVQ47070.1 MAG: cell division protein FtsQ/DivIB [Gammaproteobacteria bacterium]
MRRKTNRRRREPRPLPLPRLPRPQIRIDWRIPAWLLGLGATAWLVFEAAVLTLDQPIRAIEIEGSFHRVSALEVEAELVGDIGRGFFSADLRGMQTRLETAPWVDTAQVRRRWPDTLTVRVVEQVPAARWGEAGLLNVRGELFVEQARHLPPELPKLAGPDGAQGLVAERYLRLREQLFELGWQVVEVEMDARGAWRLMLDSGVEVRLGRRDVDARIERFLAAAGGVLAPRMAEISYVDMRYSNGFSVGWAGSALARSSDQGEGNG